MFEHPDFVEYGFDELPKDRDLFLVEDEFMGGVEAALLKSFSGGDYDPQGYFSPAAVRFIDADSAELSWFPNVTTRFHEFPIRLPRTAFVRCISSDTYDIKYIIFVKKKWLREQITREHATFVLVDAIGVKDALRSNALSQQQLLRLRARIDLLAAQHSGLSFVSVADSLVIKAEWSLEFYLTGAASTYSPETLVRVVEQLQTIYRDVLGLSVYAVFTQGVNEYYEERGIHTSDTGNHVCLNSLGVPFAELLAIDRAVSEAIKSRELAPHELYMEDTFLHSLSMRFDFKRENLARGQYQARLMRAPGAFYAASIGEILGNLEGEAPG